MKKTIFTTIIAIFAFIAFQSCEESQKTDLVSSGTYQGEVETVEADEKEIYVRTSDDKLLELYFTDKTELTKEGEMVDFKELSKGASIEVTVEKKGKKMDPIAVKILK